MFSALNVRAPQARYCMYSANQAWIILHSGKCLQPQAFACAGPNWLYDRLIYIRCLSVSPQDELRLFLSALHCDIMLVLILFYFIFISHLIIVIIKMTGRIGGSKWALHCEIRGIIGNKTPAQVENLVKFLLVVAWWMALGGCRGHGQTALTLFFPMYYALSKLPERNSSKGQFYGTAGRQELASTGVLVKYHQQICTLWSFYDS